MQVFIEQKRVERKMAYRALARLTGIPRDRLQRYLLNPRLMTLEAAERCCQALDIRSACQAIIFDIPANDPQQERA